MASHPVVLRCIAAATARAAATHHTNAKNLLCINKLHINDDKIAWQRIVVVAGTAPRLLPLRIDYRHCE
jgi:hypothetical protein